jgi:hypothetical protein
MAFDEKKDKRILEVKNEETGLWLSLCSYDGGEPKVQIGPREIEKKNGETMYIKAGRLSLDEFEWAISIYATQFKKIAPLSAKAGG